MEGVTGTGITFRSLQTPLRYEESGDHRAYVVIIYSVYVNMCVVCVPY